MLHVSPSSKRQPALLIAAFALSTLSLNAQADLTPYTRNGANLVYSSVSDVTWTQDGNLLATLFANQGYQTTVNDIIAISPTVSASDFLMDGKTTWFGAMAYVDYLNSISYGGSSQWYLPTVSNKNSGFNTTTNDTAKGDELVELFYQALNGTAGNSIPDTMPASFINKQSAVYWSGTQYAANRLGAWGFATYNGGQFDYYVYSPAYAWAVTPGKITAVPEPAELAMLLLGLGLVGCVILRWRNDAHVI